ncbi:amidase [Marinihelvus fidelis]|uniref:Amidase n=1 Tax=Marinihelvus fidelis TaxID=2613842 RepID=A0A5N0TCH9_9GAMM|nr:amidase [Marinihelvus fidelis]KAA9132742.1 amidase [Marinihelvus fidelis]
MIRPRTLHQPALVATACALVLAACASTPDVDRQDRRFNEITVDELQAAMTGGELDSVDITRHYLDRIERVDPGINAIIETNPDAEAIAAALDRERAETGPRGPLHGIPVVLKANIDTGDAMATTAGSLALVEFRAPDDAQLVTRLRDAGVVILGKANLSEWANIRSTRSSSGWSSLGGQTRNPYDTARNPCGSSSGSAAAVAANLVVLSVGTETDGSIVCPAGTNGIVGIKPTLGLVSQDGIIPIAHSQDTAGPMARTVRDAALLLDAMAISTEQTGSLLDALEDATLEGKRIGVVRNYPGAGAHPGVDAVLQSAISAMEAAGATVVDIELHTDGAGAAEWEVLLYELKADLATYLQDAGAPYASLEELIAFNKANADTVMPLFGQEIFELAQAKGDLDDPTYTEALATGRRITRGAIDSALDANDLDALLAPTNGPAWLTDPVNGDTFSIGSSSWAAISGYPNITVPAGFVSGLPIGVSLFGTAWSDAGLIAIAYAFEQATQLRRPPGDG